jgi:hypothetical protein
MMSRRRRRSEASRTCFGGGLGSDLRNLVKRKSAVLAKQSRVVNKLAAAAIAYALDKKGEEKRVRLRPPMNGLTRVPSHHQEGHLRDQARLLFEGIDFTFTITCARFDDLSRNYFYVRKRTPSSTRMPSGKQGRNLESAKSNDPCCSSCS